jgi:thioredoxin
MALMTFCVALRCTPSSTTLRAAKCTNIGLITARVYPGFQLPRRKARSLTCIAAKRVKFASFEDMLSQSDLVLVDFYATWCGPCKMMADVLQQATGKLGAVKIAKVDTEKYPVLASKYSVSGLPTLILFKQGRPLARLEGAVGASDLIGWVQQVVASSAA